MLAVAPPVASVASSFNGVSLSSSAAPETANETIVCGSMLSAVSAGAAAPRCDCRRCSSPLFSDGGCTDTCAGAPSRAERVVVFASVHSLFCDLRRLNIDALKSESAPRTREGDDTSPSISETVAVMIFPP